MIVARARGLFAAFALAGCAADPQRLDAERNAAGVELLPYALHEECVALDPGERVGFYFASSSPVAFNVHYQDGNAVIMPIVREQATREADEFTADRKEVYCLTWEAGAQGSIVEYRLRPLPPR